MTAELAGRDDLVMSILAAVPGGLTEGEITRALRTRLGMSYRRTSQRTIRRTSLRRLEAAGLARCVTEPYGGRYGFRRVWFPVEVRS